MAPPDTPERQATSRAFVARQPIFRADKTVFAYELLFRDGIEEALDRRGATAASAEVMVNSLILFGLRSLTDGRWAFVRVTEEVLRHGLVELFPADFIVPVVLPEIPAEPQVLSACAKLKKAKYSLALDRVSKAERLKEFREVIDLVTVDFAATSERVQKDIAAQAALTGVLLLARGIDSHEQLEHAKELGFVYFEGRFFAEPETVTTTEVAPNKAQYLRLMRELRDPEREVDELERIIKQDVSLSYRLLKLVNSAHFGLRAEIHSIRHALLLLGRDHVRKWATLVTLSSLGDEKPAELLVTGLMRARFREAIAPSLGLADYAEELFLVGLFSVLGALVDRPVDEVLAEMSLAESIRAALLEGEGPLGAVHELALGYERGDWRAVAYSVRELKLDEMALADAYFAAIAWATETARSV